VFGTRLEFLGPQLPAFPVLPLLELLSVELRPAPPVLNVEVLLLELGLEVALDTEQVEAFVLELVDFVKQRRDGLLELLDLHLPWIITQQLR